MPHWKTFEALAAKAIDLLDVPRMPVDQALRLLATKQRWTIDQLPPGVLLDSLRQLDSRGWIEAAGALRQVVLPGNTDVPPFTPFQWCSPMRHPTINGDWRQVWGDRVRSNDSQPAWVRVNDAGRAALTEVSTDSDQTDRPAGKSETMIKAPPPAFAAAEDFTWIVWNGRKYDFAKGNQSEAMRALWGEWEKSGRLDGCGLSEKTIGEKCGSAASDFRLAKVFLGHSAWATVIRPVGKGVFALFAESPQKPTS